jgi:hypothetical protein
VAKGFLWFSAVFCSKKPQEKLLPNHCQFIVLIAVSSHVTFPVGGSFPSPNVLKSIKLIHLLLLINFNKLV